MTGSEMEYKKLIVSSPDVLLGKPLIKDTRITVELILCKLSSGMSINEILTAYPQLKKSDIYAALSYSADVISHEEIIAC